MSIIDITGNYLGTDTDDQIRKWDYYSPDARSGVIRTLKGNDRYFKAAPVQDLIFLGAGDDTLSTSGGNDLARGDEGNDFLQGWNGNQVFDGGVGNDTLIGGLGSDILSAREGNDYLLGGFYASSQVDESSDTLTGGAGNDSLYGNAGDDVLYGNADNDLIFGDTGNDTIQGGTGSDTVYGGVGNDVIYGYHVGGIEYVVTDNGQFFAVSSDKNIFSDTGNVLYGGGGSDQIFSGFGSDTLNGGDGDDALLAVEAGNYLNRTLTLVGGIGNDYYELKNSRAKIVEDANQGIDGVQSSHDFTLPIYVENLKLSGQAIRGTGNSLANSLLGNGFENVLDGGDGNDYLGGEGGNDTLIGGVGSDELYGGDGNDILIGGQSAVLGGQSVNGYDYLVGGAGSDRFTFYNKGIPATIDDFNIAQGDKIAVSYSGFGITSSSKFTYDSKTGDFGFSSNGIVAPQVIAVLDTGLAFNAARDVVFI